MKIIFFFFIIYLCLFIRLFYVESVGEFLIILWAMIIVNFIQRIVLNEPIK